MHWAIKKNNLDIAALLVLNGSDIDSQDSSGKTPLHSAASLNKRLTIKFLLHLNANPDIKANNNKKAEDMTYDKLIKHSMHNSAKVRT